MQNKDPATSLRNNKIPLCLTKILGLEPRTYGIGPGGKPPAGNLKPEEDCWAPEMPVPVFVGGV